MRAIIIDDEKHCREGLAILLSRHCPEVQVLDHCANAKAAIKAIAQLEPDIIFLDIEMPGMNGFEMLEYCGGYDFEIIFTTAYNEYAIKAIRHSALDYLLKPVNKAELVQAVQRAGSNKKTTASTRITALLNALDIKKNAERITLSTVEGLLFVDTREIMYCESENNYTRFHLADNKVIVVSKTLKKVEELLSGNADFFRIHQSYLVNLNYVQRYIKGDGGELVMKNGDNLLVSRSKKGAFLELLERL